VHAVSTLIERKISENTAVLFGSIWSIMLPVVLAGIGYLIYRAPGRMRGLHQRIPPLSAGLVGLGVLTVLGTGLNDSGIAIAGVMLGVMTPVLIVVTVRGDRVVPRRSSPTPVGLTAPTS
jgi:ABC-type polysaccharide/polyol phosphate export permease